jgi:hypothetical protein
MGQSRGWRGWRESKGESSTTEAQRFTEKEGRKESARGGAEDAEKREKDIDADYSGENLAL